MFEVWVVRWSWNSDLGRAQKSLRITGVHHVGYYIKLHAIVYASQVQPAAQLKFSL